MDTKILEKWHPKLQNKNYKIIPTKDLDKFNCFSFVIDIFDDWSGSSTKIWHNPNNRYATAKNYIEFYSTYGFQVCDNELFEDGYDKIALYEKDNFITHACKQFNNMWRSKLGCNVIIEHELEWLSGTVSENYGEIVAIMKRKIK